MSEKLNTRPSQLALALNHAIGTVQQAWSRMAAARFGAGIPLDTKRTAAWCEYGWPEVVDNDMLYNLYRRTGVAHGSVNKIVQTCWKTAPELIEGDESEESEDSTAWEAAATKVLTASMWSVWSELDRRRLVSRFSGLILQIADNKAWDQPVTGRPVLRNVIPAWASALQPMEIVPDVNSENYGKPAFWQYTERPINGTGGRQVKIHPDRIFILGDWSTDCIAFLEPAYNAFVSLEKVEGGSGESFLKNASRQVAVSFDKEVNLSQLASTYGVSLDALQEKFNDAARDMNRGIDQMLVLQGATATPLVAQVADPKSTYDVNLQTISAALDIPTKILIGMQTGERASTEDQKYFNGRCQSRRQDLSLDIMLYAQHLIRIGVLKPMAEFHVLWDDLNEQTASEKLASAKTMSEINSVAVTTGELVFDADEIRTAAGYEPGAHALPDADPKEPSGNPPQDPPADPAQE